MRTRKTAKHEDELEQLQQDEAAVEADAEQEADGEDWKPTKRGVPFSIDCPALREAFATNPWLTFDEARLVATAKELGFSRSQLWNYWFRSRQKALKKRIPIFPEPWPGQEAISSRLRLTRPVLPESEESATTLVPAPVADVAEPSGSANGLPFLRRSIRGKDGESTSVTTDLADVQVVTSQTTKQTKRKSPKQSTRTSRRTIPQDTPSQADLGPEHDSDHQAERSSEPAAETQPIVTADAAQSADIAGGQLSDDEELTDIEDFKAFLTPEAEMDEETTPPTSAPPSQPTLIIVPLQQTHKRSRDDCPSSPEEPLSKRVHFAISDEEQQNDAVNTVPILGGQTKLPASNNRSSKARAKPKPAKSAKSSVKTGIKGQGKGRRKVPSKKKGSNSSRYENDTDFELDHEVDTDFELEEKPKSKTKSKPKGKKALGKKAPQKVKSPAADAAALPEMDPAQQKPAIATPEKAEPDLSMPYYATPTLSELSELLTTPSKPAVELSEAETGIHAAVKAAKPPLPPLRPFPAVVEYSKPSHPEPEVEEESPKAEPASTGIEADSSSTTNAAFRGAEDEQFWVECALGLKKLDPTDLQCSSLSDEMQNLTKEKFGADAQSPAALDTKAHEHSVFQSDAAEEVPLPTKSVPAFLPPSLARSASKDTLSSKPILHIVVESEALSIKSIVDDDHVDEAVEVTKTLDTEPTSSIGGARGALSTSASSSSSVDSINTPPESVTLGSPIALHSELPLPGWASPSPQHGYQLEPLPYIWEHAYEADPKPIHSRQAYSDTMISQQAYVPVAPPHQQLHFHHNLVGPEIPTPPTDRWSSFGTWRPPAPADDTYISPTTQRFGLQIPQIVYIPPTPLQTESE